MGVPEDDMQRPACPGCAERDRRIAELEERLGRLEERLDQARRAGKRQAAPFRKGPPKGEPKKPGRKGGDGYGAKAYRAAPPPDRIDEEHEAPLPDRCPGCGAPGGELHETHVAEQYQVDLPRRPIHRRFRIHAGECGCCGKRVRGRHELQTSDAVGAAASQLGPNLQATMAHLNKHAGLSHGKIADLLQALWDIRVDRSGVCHAVLRAGRRCAGTYRQIIEHINASPAATSDETGWRIGGRNAWNHVATTPQATAFHIDYKRGYEAVTRLIDPGYTGVMIHDGWASYDRFRHTSHQTCLAHLLRRCHELLDTATRGAVVFPRRIRDLLKQITRLRHRWAAGEIDAADAAAHADRIETRLSKLVRPIKTHRGNERLAAHLQRQLPNLLTCLRVEGVEATNWRAEQAIRPAVVNRKVWGGNRTEAGARAQSILTSILTTCRQQSHDPITHLALTLRGQPPPLTP